MNGSVFFERATSTPLVSTISPKIHESIYKNIPQLDVFTLLDNPNILRFLNAFRELSAEESIAYVNINIKEWAEKYRENRKELTKETKELEAEEKYGNDEEESKIGKTETVYESIAVAIEPKKETFVKLDCNSSVSDICHVFKENFEQAQDQQSEACLQVMNFQIIFLLNKCF